MLRLEEWEDGFRLTLVIKDGQNATQFKKEYWIGANGNGAEYEPDKKFLTELVASANGNTSGELSDGE